MANSPHPLGLLRPRTQRPRLPGPERATPPWTERRHCGGDSPGCSRRPWVRRVPPRRGAHPLCGGPETVAEWTAVLVVPGGGVALAAGWMFFRAELRRRWRAWLALALIVGRSPGSSRPRRPGRAAPTPPTRACRPGVTHRTSCCSRSAGYPRRSAGSRPRRRRLSRRRARPPSWPATRWRRRLRRRSSRRRTPWSPAGSGAAGSWPAACLTRPGPMRWTSPSPWPRPPAWASGTPCAPRC